MLDTLLNALSLLGFIWLQVNAQADGDNAGRDIEAVDLCGERRVFNRIWGYWAASIPNAWDRNGFNFGYFLGLEYPNKHNEMYQRLPESKCEIHLFPRLNMHGLEVILDGIFSEPPSGCQCIHEVSCGASDVGHHFSVHKVLDSGAFWVLYSCTRNIPLVSNQLSLLTAGPSPTSHAWSASDFKMQFVCQSILLRTTFRNTQEV